MSTEDSDSYSDSAIDRRRVAGELKTIPIEIEPETVGAHSGLSNETCQEWEDAEPDAERFVPTQCGNDATHTLVVKTANGLSEVAMCDECGIPDDVDASDREWSA